MTENEKVEKLIALAKEGKTVRILGIGNSMRPLLHGGRDYIYFRALRKDESYQKGDVVLYQWDGIYVMHRIADIVPEGYIMLGDGNQFKEEPLSEDRIYLKAEGFLRNGRYISVQNKLYRIYVSLWVNFWKLRPFVRRCKAILNKITGKERES